MYEVHLRSLHGHISDAVIDKQIEADFLRWFREYVSIHIDV